MPTITKKHTLALPCALVIFVYAFAAKADDASVISNAKNSTGPDSAAAETPPSSTEFDSIKTELLPFYDDNWSIYADGTAIIQGYPSFHATYSGAQSVPPSSKGDNLEVVDFSLGRRLWQGGTIYFDPQFYRGFGFNDTLGLAGFPDGEANKGGTTYVSPNIERVYFQQTIGFGGETEAVERGPNQLHDTVDISRLTITAGKFPITDEFDNNTYSHNPETQFLNFDFVDSLAWDWPQNGKGTAWGSVFDFNQKDWAVRYGAMIPVNEINGDDFRLHGVNELDNTVELEERYNLDNNPGKTRFLLFYNRERSGNFDDALETGDDINSAISDTRKYGRQEYGFVLNFEQQLEDDLGTFARLSWNNGKNENFGFSQADESFTVGLSLKGKRWQRDDDVVGVAAAVNGISKEQRQALQAGYTNGLIIGDGNLSYSGESILETYYNYALTDYAFIGPDYQFVLNPAYNDDRGPVNIFAARLHVEF